jgi:16S rRNA A1518/A1519 N6-dimethyltransferase RsmA/KsgA/DIM1 with predicted DNA glycosylase/AP lyase activity
MKRLHTFSQNFLRSPRFVAELIGHTSIKASDTVYDIGAGSGVVTSVLAKKCHTVVAVEIDPRMAAKLRDNMRDYTNVTVYQADFLSMPLPHTPYKVFANIPFSLSAVIVRKLSEAQFPPQAAYLIVQKQFANKLLSDGNRYTSQLAIMLGPKFAVRIRKPLQRSDFVPRPNVDTVLLEIKLRPVPLINEAELPMFQQFVAGCFIEPRKLARAPLERVNIAPGTKASSLSLDAWIALYAAATSPK